MNYNFEIVGYHLDYYNDRNKFIGSVSIEKPNTNIFGYRSRKYSVADKKISFGKKCIKPGERYYSEIIPLCGKFIGTEKEKLDAMYNSKIFYNG